MRHRPASSFDDAGHNMILTGQNTVPFKKSRVPSHRGHLLCHREASHCREVVQDRHMQLAHLKIPSTFKHLPAAQSRR